MKTESKGAEIVTTQEVVLPTLLANLVLMRGKKVVDLRRSELDFMSMRVARMQYAPGFKQWLDHPDHLTACDTIHRQGEGTIIERDGRRYLNIAPFVPMCAIIVAWNASPKRWPLGRAVLTACRALIGGTGGVRGLLVARMFRSGTPNNWPLTVRADQVTCPECRKLLDAGGWDGPGMCPVCDRFPYEGHKPTCSFVDCYGFPARPVEGKVGSR